MNNIVDLACQLEETCRFCYPPEKERILYATKMGVICFQSRLLHSNLSVSELKERR